MAKRTDIKSILIIGAGPIVIGQACEFDYSGAQACKALREEGYRVILVNSNPATIMTDPEMADATYIEPVTWQVVEKIIEKGEERSILISSHISSDLETLCDDLYMIHQGKVIMHEDTDVLLSDYALLKVDEEEYSKLDRQYILRTKKESYGYSCLTNQKQYYAENYPQMAIEKGNIDEVITMMIRGVE